MKKLLNREGAKAQRVLFIPDRNGRSEKEPCPDGQKK